MGCVKSKGSEVQSNIEFDGVAVEDNAEGRKSALR
jgi:hypothetical protein